MPRPCPIDRIRNIGIIAHIDAGKTTVTERVLFYTGKTYKIGEVHEGDTQMDWMEQEKERGITITSAATTCFWPREPKEKQCQINIIDTPGHIDFTVEVQRSLRVLDGAVVVFDGKMGVEPQSETVWRQADNYHVPRMCFANKINLLGGNFEMTLKSIQERLSPHAFPVMLPIGLQEEFRGIVDLIEQKAFVYKDETGMDFVEADIPENIKDNVKKFREQMIEKVVEIDDVLTEKYLNGQDISADELKKAIRQGVISGKFFPVLGGDGRRAVVKFLLDAIVEFLPSPQDLPAIIGHDLKTEAEVIRERIDEQAFSALAFKIATDPFIGQLTYFRVYSGVLSSGSYVLNASTGEQERISRLVRMHAAKREEVKEFYSGEIGAIVGLKKTTTGDTLCDPAKPVILEKIEFPEPVIYVAIEPDSKQDQEKMGSALHRLGEEDPTFRISGDPETGQTIIAGMGELHLEIIVDRMRREFNVKATVGQPQVAYKETIQQMAEAEGKYIRQSGGRGQYGHVWLKVEPQEQGVGFEFVNAIKGGIIPQEYIPAVKKGVQEALDRGVIAGYPMVDVKTTLYDGSFHDVDSSEAAFKIAGSMALQSAAKRARPVLLEPIMRLQTIAPEKFMGDVIGDINAKRGQIESMEDRGEGQAAVKVINSKVPLAEMFGYATALRSLTQGRGNFTMEFDHYAPVPSNVAEKIMAERGVGKK